MAKIIKVSLSRPVKLEGKWYYPPRTLKVNEQIAAEIVVAKAGSLTDPDTDLDVSSLPDKNVDRDTLVSGLCDIDGISTDLAEKLIDAGFSTVKAIYDADDSELQEINGIGPKLVKTIQDSAGDLVIDDSE